MSLARGSLLIFCAILSFTKMLGQSRPSNPILPALFKLEVEGGEQDQSCSAFVIHKDGPQGNRTLYFLTAAHCFFGKTSDRPKTAKVNYGGRALPVEISTIRIVPSIGLSDRVYLEDVALFWVSGTGLESTTLPIDCTRRDDDDNFLAAGYPNGSNQAVVMPGAFVDVGTTTSGYFTAAVDFQHGMSGGPVIARGRVVGLVKGFSAPDFGPGTSLKEVVPIQRAELLFPYVNAFAGCTRQPYSLSALRLEGKIAVVKKVQNDIIQPFDRFSESVNVGCEQSANVNVVYELPSGATLVGSPVASWTDTNNLQTTTADVQVVGNRVVAKGALTGLAFQSFGFVRNCPGGGHGRLVLRGNISSRGGIEERSLEEVSRNIAKNEPVTIQLPADTNLDGFQLQVRATTAGDVIDSFAISNPDWTKLPIKVRSTRNLFEATVLNRSKIRIAPLDDFDSRFAILDSLQAAEALAKQNLSLEIQKFQQTVRQR